MLVKIWNMEFHFLLVGTQNVTATLQDSVAVSYKTKHTGLGCAQWNSRYVAHF